MIDLVQAEREFKKYAQNYDMSLDGIERKYHHSFRVMNISTEIAKSLNLDEEQVALATLIGLLHDIARFEEFMKYKGFTLEHKFDHGDYALEILKKDNFIRKFIETDKYDDIIFAAIKNHNKFQIEDGLNEETLLYCKIIRDADKIDILYEATCIFWNNKKEEMEKSQISDSYFEQFMNQQVILRLPEQTILDEIVVYLAFIFDMNFKYSFEKLKIEDYMDKMLNRFEFEKPETIDKLNKIKVLANKFINEKSI